jgi:CIC family chloride channel protein
MAGGAIGTVTRLVAPFPTADAGAYALVGMGALFAGIIRAPMTSVFMIFEITQDYQIVVPLMVANLTSYMISRRYQPVPVYHALLEQDGVILPPPGSLKTPDRWTAGDVMRRDVLLLSPRHSVDEAALDTHGRAERAFLVGTEAGILGAVTIDDLRAAVAGGAGATSIVALTRPVPAPLFEGDFHDAVLDRLAAHSGPVPVVHPDTGHMRGTIEPSDVVRYLARRKSGEEAWTQS